MALEKGAIQKAGEAVSAFCKGFVGSTGGGCCGLEVPKKDLDELKKVKKGKAEKTDEKIRP